MTTEFRIGVDYIIHYFLDLDNKGGHTLTKIVCDLFESIGGDIPRRLAAGLLSNIWPTG